MVYSTIASAAGLKIFFKRRVGYFFPALFGPIYEIRMNVEEYGLIDSIIITL